MNRVKITCKQQDLSRGLVAVSHAVPTNTTLPILSNIVLATDRGRLKLSATNLEIGITCWVDAEVHEEGTITVPAKLLVDFVATLSSGPVELDLPDASMTLKVKCLGNHANIKGMDAAEFPHIPGAEEGGELTCTLEASLLKEMIGEVAFAAADDDSRPILTGVLVEIRKEGKLTLAAADAFRLAVSVTALPEEGQVTVDLLIPARSLAHLARILPPEGPVEVYVSANGSQVLFHTRNLDLASRLIEGNFPNFRQILPKEHATRAVVETKQFADAVKRAALFARDSSNITRVKIEPGGTGGEEGGSLIVEATAEDLGDNTSTVSAAIDGAPLAIIFNVKYLVDVLAVIDTPEVALETSSVTKPGVIRPVGGHDFTYVIMPMHVNT
jgi:DNA polymerase III subunit beta